MKKILCLAVFFCITIINAQETNTKNKADFKLGSGLNFSFNEGAYQFRVSGFIQPTISYEKTKGLDSDFAFNSKRNFFMLSGKAVNEKVSFLLQTDFSLAQPLLDAWVAYHPYNWLTLTAGQKQSFLNNREMIYREDKLQFTERSRFSQLYSKTGREFGLFIETKFGERFIIAPSFAVTSGDGRNSFGADSRDADLGGVKIGGRVDFYPAGAFTSGNDQYTADIAHEQTPKVLVGVAASKNNGASNATGEGHGDFMLYDANGKNNLPDYSQIFTDILFKYKGFSFLAEYASSSASNLGQSYIDANGVSVLAPQQISEYLVLGDSYSLQTGYVTSKGLSFDFRYEKTEPEFASYTNSLLQDSKSYTFGFTKYFDGNNLKLQTAVSKIDFTQGSDLYIGEIVLQIVF
ncbi:hypothetical protein [Tenacibaculum sp. IB213877]|uniref:hypothetical protein n=1 Tax=Tenacibaculum sp. IB213877 TaxID=3097351 RepID=UPI002A5AE248|nr:hypothetical protein [Tenacibaculum sp. IB213877]MDY0781430.1 hypothetical protein [Tenacibaculum sp. IB213877]